MSPNEIVEEYTRKTSAKPKFPATQAGIFDPFDYGARGDGRTLDTSAIQSALDNCHRAGGGKVYLHSGTFVSGTLYLKSHVTLEIEAGTVLRASDNLADFPITASKYPSYTGEMVTNKMLIYAEKASNITLCGRGAIDGNGEQWKDGPYAFPSFSVRPRIIHLRGCQNIRIGELTLSNSASWVQSYQDCRNLVIDGITVESRENKDIEKERWADARGRNTDGLDLIDCQQVRVSNCFINSGDDALCLKSYSPDAFCQDITITNCVITANASGIKIGTETAGHFRDITIQNCTIFDTRVDALSLISADGARLERITLSNISVRNIKGAAFFIRLCARNRLYRKNAIPNQPFLKDIIVENLQGTGISAGSGCSVTGISDFPLENISLRNINLEFEGGRRAEDSFRPIPDQEDGYPKGEIFATLPTYGIFIRHAKNIRLENIRLRNRQEDERPALLCDKVGHLEIRALQAPGTPNSPEMVRLVDARHVTIRESRASTPIPVFLSVYGDLSQEIFLKDNAMGNVEQSVVFEKESLKTAHREAGSPGSKGISSTCNEPCEARLSNAAD